MTFPGLGSLGIQTSAAAQSDGAINAPFNIGSGTAGGIPAIVWIGALVVGAIVLLKRR